jgi:hypothetical protein
MRMKNANTSGRKLTPFHEWRKTHPDGTMDEYFTDVQGLTPYDKGTRAEPKVWEERHRESNDDFGKVDFNAEDDFTIATLYIERDSDGSYVLRGYTNEPLKIEVEDQS